MAFRLKMRAKLFAITQEMPAPRRAMGACSREEPQPKFLPAHHDVARLHAREEGFVEVLHAVRSQLLGVERCSSTARG